MASGRHLSELRERLRLDGRKTARLLGEGLKFELTSDWTPTVTWCVFSVTDQYWDDEACRKHLAWLYKRARLASENERVFVFEMMSDQKLKPMHKRLIEKIANLSQTCEQIDMCRFGAGHATSSGTRKPAWKRLTFMSNCSRNTFGPLLGRCNHRKSEHHVEKTFVAAQETDPASKNFATMAAQCIRALT